MQPYGEGTGLAQQRSDKKNEEKEKTDSMDHSALPPIFYVTYFIIIDIGVIAITVVDKDSIQPTSIFDNSLN
ncbi:MAG: hypothetical protein Kow0042_27820 [Calditrichia bacterium]